VIDSFKSPKRPVDKPMRFSVNDIFKNTGSGYSISGHMETGMISIGDKVLILPPSESAIVKGSHFHIVHYNYKTEYIFVVFYYV
jgi:translation elongation factor EF-1alpha